MVVTRRYPQTDDPDTLFGAPCWCPLIYHMQTVRGSSLNLSDTNLWDVVQLCRSRDCSDSASWVSVLRFSKSPQSENLHLQQTDWSMYLICLDEWVLPKFQWILASCPLSVLIYEYILTLPQEIQLVWKHKTSRETLLFLLNQYVMVGYSILLSVPIPPPVHQPSKESGDMVLTTLNRGKLALYLATTYSKGLINQLRCWSEIERGYLIDSVHNICLYIIYKLEPRKKLLKALQCSLDCVYTHFGTVTCFFPYWCRP